MDKNNQTSDAKKPRLEFPQRCYNYGKIGHIATDCRGSTSKNQTTHDNRSQSSTTNNLLQRKESRPITCFRCGELGHIAPRCTQKDMKPDDREQPKIKRNVNICAIKPAADHLFNLGEKFSFCFDAGSECSLIKETVAQRFPGKINYDLVTLLGIGKSSLHCYIQIIATVTLQGYSVELLFHVVPDTSLVSDILIGRDLIT